EAVRLRDCGSPFLYDLVLVRRATRHGRRCWLIEERHGKVAKIEKPSVDTLALLQVLQNPLSRLFRETALAGASNNYGNNGHAFAPCGSPIEKGSSQTRRSLADGSICRALRRPVHTGCFNAAVSIGSFRKRLPVAAKIALVTAGTMAEVPGSPIPPGGSALWAMWTSMAGASFMRSIW